MTESTEVQFQIVAHVISSAVRDCGCTESVTARLVLRDSDGYNRAVLAVGDPERTFDASVESALRRFESSARALAAEGSE
jgi:hypothetical protein